MTCVYVHVLGIKYTGSNLPLQGMDMDMEYWNNNNYMKGQMIPIISVTSAENENATDDHKLHETKELAFLSNITDELNDTDSTEGMESTVTEGPPDYDESRIQRLVERSKGEEKGSFQQRTEDLLYSLQWLRSELVSLLDSEKISIQGTANVYPL